MKAVLLAAGAGTRLGTLTDTRPKCLLTVPGRSLLEHHLDALSAAGIEDVTIVAGFEARQIIDHVAGRHRVLVNAAFASTNSIVSLHLAAPYVRDGAFLFQNADVLYAPALVRRLVDFPRGNACLVDGGTDWSDAEYHIETAAGRVTRYSRDIPPDRAVARSAQLMKVGAADAPAFLDRLGRLIAEGGGRGFPNQAYDVLIAGEGLWPVFTAGLRWHEIDTPQDYAACLAAMEEPLPETVTTEPITERMASILREPRIPWRYRWVPRVADAALRRPFHTARLVRAYRQGRLSLDGLDLQANGARMLERVVHGCAAAGLRPILLWGSLLGHLRDRGFIWNDRDIDLGIMETERGAVPRLRDAMLADGFRVRIDGAQKLSLLHPNHPRLFLDLDVVHRHRDGWGITNAEARPDRIFHYVFDAPVFDRITEVRFMGCQVFVPGLPEAFLTAVYGDWTVPQPKADYLYGPLNVEVELRSVRDLR